MGETARSVKERAKEHWEDFKSKKSDSHIMKHWALHQNLIGEPNFIMKVVQYHKSTLSRQVGEAIRIQSRGLILNSRAEYNRCHITRLSLEQMDHENGSKEQEDQGGEADMDTDWTIGMFENRDKVDGELRKSLGKLTRTESSKRRDDSTMI